MIRAVDQVQVIHLRGMDERGATGPSTVFLNALDDSQVLRWRMTYPHDSGEQVTPEETVAVARAGTIELIRAARKTVVLSGYSGGAYIAGALAADIAAGRIDGISPDKILACALLGDPYRPEHGGAPGIPTPPGHGIAGQRDIPGITTYWGTAAHDPIAALPADSPLRRLVGMPPLLGRDPRGATAWARDIAQTLITRQQQPRWRHPLHHRTQWQTTIAALNGYAWQGWHSHDYIQDGVCTALAEAVNKAVTG